MIQDVPGYELLAQVMRLAYDQAANGKGAQRHAQAIQQPFNEQPIMQLTRLLGTEGPTFQVVKKLEEARRLPPDRALQEALGAVVYSAAIAAHYVLLQKEQKEKGL